MCWKRNSYFFAFVVALLLYLSPILLPENGFVYADSSSTNITQSAEPSATLATSESLDELKIKAEEKKEKRMVVYWTLAVLVLIISGMFGYMWSLRSQFFNGCKDEKQMTLFAQSPAGLPSGTVRSMIALSIVILSLYLIALQILGIGLEGFPEALGSLLGAVIGFYFGSRSVGGNDKGLTTQIDTLTQQRDKAVSDKDGDKAQSILKKVTKGIALTKTVLKYLPAEQRKKYEKLVGKLEQGVSLAKGMEKIGQVSDAVTKAKGAFTEFVEKNPVADLVKKSAASFQRALGVSLPQVALVTAVVAVGSGLAGLAYQKWKARILQAPFSPAELPLKLVDANTGFSLIMASPLFKKAFMQPLLDNDRPFMQSVVEACIKEADTNKIFVQYKAYFESRESFEAGLIQFRHSAADRELIDFIGNDALAEFGGYNNFIEMIDKIHMDENALADLDSLVVVSENLKNEGEPVVKLFKKASEGIE